MGRAVAVLPQGAVLFQLVAKSGFDATKFAAERETTRTELKRQETARLEEAMYQHARHLEFEEAARVRDRLAALKERLFVSA